MKRYHFFKGRVALTAILEALDIGPGDQVLLPGFTCVVVPNAIVYRGAEPVFLDIDPSTYNLDPDKVEAACGTSWDPGRAKALLVQHTFGLAADVDRLVPLARLHDMAVVEDSCHALGSLVGDRKVGTLGDAAFFSSQWSKPVTTGLGGWAVAADEALEIEVAAVHGSMRAPSMATTTLLSTQYATYRQLFRGSLFWTLRDLYRWLSGTGLVVGSSTADELESRMPNDYRRTMGTPQRRRLERHLGDDGRRRAHSRALQQKYDALVTDVGLRPLAIPEGHDPVLLRYPVEVGDKVKLLDEARSRRIEIGDWFVSPVHPVEEPGWATAGYQAGSCPVAERACERIVNLPMHPGVTDRDLERIHQLLADVRG